MQIISATEIGYNFNRFNQMQNTYELKIINPELDYPKSLVKEALKWIKEECDDYKIDFNSYGYMEITKFDGVTYQVDLRQSEDVLGATLSLYDIYFDTKSRKIMQANFGI